MADTLLLNLEEAPENLHLELALTRASARPGRPSVEVLHAFTHDYDFIPRPPAARARRLPIQAAGDPRERAWDAAVFIDVPWRRPALLRWLQWLAGVRAPRKVLVLNHLFRPDVAAAPVAAGALKLFDRVWALRHDDLETLSCAVRPGALVPYDYALDCRYYAPAPEVPLEGYAFAAGGAHRDYPLLAEALAAAGLPGRIFADDEPTRRLSGPGLDVISLIANLDRLRTAIAAARLVAVPTRPEPFDAAGLTVALMGLAMGKPVVARDTGRMRRYIEPGASGFLYVGGSRDSLAAALRAADAAAEDPAFAGRARRAALELADLERFAERVLEEAGCPT